MLVSSVPLPIPKLLGVLSNQLVLIVVPNHQHGVEYDGDCPYGIHYPFGLHYLLIDFLFLNELQLPLRLVERQWPIDRL